MDVFENIKQWAHDRNLIKGATPQAQMLKMTEEVGELAHAIARKGNGMQLNNIKDAIGDCTVVLTILAAQCNLDYLDCVDGAYNEIKDRKGKMIDGVFVKED